MLLGTLPSDRTSNYFLSDKLHTGDFQVECLHLPSLGYPHSAHNSTQFDIVEPTPGNLSHIHTFQI